MSLFFLMFLTIYGGMNAYFLWKVSSAFRLGRWSASVAAVLVLLVVMPMTVRLVEHSGRELLARILAHAGYAWMGFLLLFVTMALLVDACRLAGRLAGASVDAVSPALAFAIPAAVAAVVAVYGFFEAGAIRTETVSIRSPKVPVEVGEIRVAQMSDVHLGLLVREDRLAKVLHEVESARPHLIVATGDVVDGQLGELHLLRDMLARLSAPLGKYAVTGNHEFYARLDQSLAFLRNTGFTVLQGATAKPAHWLAVAGVDDQVARRFGRRIVAPEVPSDPAVFTILLKHRPVPEDATPKPDLQLSGHVHQGQIFPFVVATRLSYPIPTGLTLLSAASALYVSRGCGTWGPPMRVLAPPEVTVFRLSHGDTFSAAVER